MALSADAALRLIQALASPTAGQEVTTALNNSVVGANPTFGNLALTGLLTESAADGLVATTGGQAGALALALELNRFVTVAAGFGGKLPLAAPGLTIFVVNHGLNPLQVYGAGTDTINDVAGATGVTQMVNSTVLYFCSVAGKWYTEGLATGFAGGFQTVSYADALVANVGGGQLNGTPVTTMIARFTGVASAGDSGKLPASVAGMQLTVINAHAVNSMNVFPFLGDTINALAANAAFALAAGKTATFSCATAGQWHSVLSA